MSSRRACRRAKLRFANHLADIAEALEPQPLTNEERYNGLIRRDLDHCFDDDRYDGYEDVEVDDDFYNVALDWDFDEYDWDDYEDPEPSPMCGEFWKDGDDTYLYCHVHGVHVFVDVLTGQEVKPNWFRLEKVG